MALLRRLPFLVATLALAVACSGFDRPRPVLIVVSFDGWRWDYTDKADIPRLRDLASRGVRAARLIPPFPPRTFPSHYTIVTGLYPEHHGVVSNAMVEPGVPARFAMGAETATDPRWWGGEPLWVTAVRQRQRAAAMFWPGSDVAVNGVRPTYWKPFDDDFPNADRVQQVLNWLALPPDERPSLVTLYFSEVDAAGHQYGPDSPEVLKAASHLDDMLGALVSGVEQLGLLDRTTFVVVSDHGMSQLSEDRVIFLDDYIDLSTIDIVEWTPALGVAPSSGSVDAVHNALKGKHPALAVYRREDVPAALHYNDNPRIPPIVGIADDGWTITSHARFASFRAAGRPLGGAHGYDPVHQSMHGIFVAAGPGIRQGALVPAFENVHLYEFFCRILDVTPATNDGDRNATRGFFVN